MYTRQLVRKQGFNNKGLIYGSPKSPKKIPLSVPPHTPVLGSPIYGVFSPPAGEYSYALFTIVLIGRRRARAGKRLTASLDRTTSGTGNKLTYHNMSCILLLEWSTTSQRLWVYRISVPYAQKDPRFLFEKRRGHPGNSGLSSQQ